MSSASWIRRVMVMSSEVISFFGFHDVLLKDLHLIDVFLHDGRIKGLELDLKGDRLHGGNSVVHCV